MSVFAHAEFDGHEQIVHAFDADTGLRAIIAVHNTARGPAVGGCRMWPYTDEAAALTALYPPPVPGFHRRHLAGGRVVLTLLFGPVEDMLASLSARADAWYLDGFAPRANPDMWTPALFQHMRRLSAPGARFATFTAAGDVRRGLAEAGFAVGKAPGFGRKRDCLRGELIAKPDPHPAASP